MRKESNSAILYQQLPHIKYNKHDIMYNSNPTIKSPGINQTKAQLLPRKSIKEHNIFNKWRDCTMFIYGMNNM